MLSGFFVCQWENLLYNSSVVSAHPLHISVRFCATALSTFYFGYSKTARWRRKKCQCSPLHIILNNVVERIFFLVIYMCFPFHVCGLFKAIPFFARAKYMIDLVQCAAAGSRRRERGRGAADTFSSKHSSPPSENTVHITSSTNRDAVTQAFFTSETSLFMLKLTTQISSTRDACTKAFSLSKCLFSTHGQYVKIED